MKKIYIQYIFTFLLTCVGLNSFADGNDSLRIDSNKREIKEEKLRSRWEKLIPKQNKLQFAGSMGMLSASIGWYYGRHNQWETDWYIGYIPKMNHQGRHVTTTLKQTYTPWRFKLKNNIYMEPLTTGLYINKIFGQYFWNNLPDRYPDGYYFWAVNTRFNLFVGQAYTLKLKHSPIGIGRELSFFYEVNSNDLYMISAFQNKTIGLRDILSLSVGIRYRVL